MYELIIAQKKNKKILMANFELFWFTDSFVASSPSAGRRPQSQTKDEALP